MSTAVDVTEVYEVPLGDVGRRNMNMYRTRIRVLVGARGGRHVPKLRESRLRATKDSG
jgi:hypothetical protein